jgi:uncharacterized protein YjiS (DUF1127 family)
MSASGTAWCSVAPVPASTWRMLATRWMARLQERAEMAAMTARERRDAGLSAHDVERECRAPFWRD